MMCDWSFRDSSRCENQSCVMNWIQKASSTLKNGAFRYGHSASIESDGRELFASRQGVPVITRGNPTDVEVVVQPVP